MVFKIFRILYFLSIAGLFSCANKIEEASSASTIGTSYVGTWKVDNIRCAQGNIAIEGLADYLILGENTGNNVSYGSACYVQVNNFSISKTSSSISMSGGSSSCSSNSCSIPWKAIGPAGSSLQSYDCPSEASVPSGNWIVEGNYLKADAGSGCWMYYIKTTEAPPSMECLMTQAPTSTYTAMGIYADGVDKGAMQFQVIGNKSLRAIQVMMTSSNLNSAQILLYEGGATPDAGTLRATSVINKALGQSTPSLHVFEFSPTVSLTTGTDYYVVLKGTGTAGYFNVGGNTQNLISAGAMWSFNGTSWSANTSVDLALGFVYESVGCP